MPTTTSKLTLEEVQVAGPKSARRHWYAIALLVIFQLGFTMFVNPTGHLTGDSGTYHLMVHNLSEHGSFIIENGWEEFPSEELRIGELRTPADRLAAQYPEGYTLLSYPFYKVSGYQGLFLLNSLAFLGVLWLVHRLALDLFHSARLAMSAVLVYGLGTYAWEYSQSDVPHMASTFLIVTAFWLALGARRSHRPLFTCVLAGFIAGVAVTVRLDALFGVMAVATPLAVLSTFCLKRLAAFGVGLAPGFLFLSATNLEKFGTLSPLSYGVPPSAGSASLAVSFLPGVSVAALAALGVIWFQLTARWRKRMAVGLIAGGVCALAMFFGPVSAIVSRFANGFYQIVVDMRIRDMDIAEVMLTRTSDGAMVYFGSVKKALLESCPYLVVLIVPIIAMLRGRPGWRETLCLMVAPAVFLGYYGYFAWHGNVALNMRYLNPILPFTSVAVAATLHQAPFQRIAGRKVAAIGGTIFAILLLVAAWPWALRQQEVVFLTAPMVAAAVILALVGLAAWKPSRATAKAATYGAIAAIAWSGAVTFGRDYLDTAYFQKLEHDVSGVVMPMIPPNALVFCPHYCWDLMERGDQVLLARPEQDDNASAGALAEFHLAHNRPVYTVLLAEQNKSFWAEPSFSGLSPDSVETVDIGGKPRLIVTRVLRK